MARRGWYYRKKCEGRFCKGKMIRVKGLKKSFRHRDHSWKHVLTGLTFDLPDDMNLGILGRNGVGKSTLINIISGRMLPDEGTVEVSKGQSLSWPLGSVAGVHSALTGIDNVKFISRIYDRDWREVLHFVEEFAELKEYLHMPLNSYSSGMKGRLAFGISMAIDFDTYLIDEGFSPGDARFKAKSSDIFLDKRKNSNMIMVSHSPGLMARFCNHIGVLRNGNLEIYDNIKKAIEIYQDL